MLNSSPKCFLYKHVVDNICLQRYLTKPLFYRKFLTKLRLSSHNLYVETGRYYGIERASRKCNLCVLNVIEDEYHFVLQCPCYSDLRKQYLKSYYYKKPSTFKLVQLLSTENVKDLRNLCKFIYHAFNLRSATIV